SKAIRGCTYPLFFFQAEDGIRGFHVTGVQTCALPIFLCARKTPSSPLMIRKAAFNHPPRPFGVIELGQPSLSVYERTCSFRTARSEERRVGKEGASQRGTDAEEAIQAAKGLLTGR